MPCCRLCAVDLVVGDTWHLSRHRKRENICISCRSQKTNPVSNAQRMYVNGKYIPSSHPLHKPGRYKSFSDAAFASLQNYTSAKEGYVYVITNPAWDGWVKVGMAIDAEDRLAGYQTSSPFRDYELTYSVYCDDRRLSERKAHKAVGLLANCRKGEWFQLPVEDAVDCISALLKQQNSP